MARPSKRPKDRLSYAIRVYFTSEQVRLITHKAQKAALELSPFLRTVALKGRVKAPRVPAANLAALRQLRQLDNNLNQLTRYFNTQPPPEEGDVAEHITALRAIVAALERQLLGWSAAPDPWPTSRPRDQTAPIRESSSGEPTQGLSTSALMRSTTGYTQEAPDPSHNADRETSQESTGRRGRRGDAHENRHARR